MTARNRELLGLFPVALLITAGFTAVYLSRQTDLAQAFRYAMGSAAAALLTAGTALCQPADVERLAREVVVTPAGA